MSNIENPLADKYNDYLDLLDTLCICYDLMNKEVLALSISAAIRTLVHDTDRSTSLLQHLDLKDKTRFISTNNKSRDEPVHLGLVRKINVGVSDGIGGEAKYWANCDEKYFPSPSIKYYLSFTDWWNEDIFICNETKLTRHDLICITANKDGGAHFDKKIPKKYDDFRYSWSGKSSLVGIKSGIFRGYDNIPTYPAIRQMGYELIQSLRK